MAPRSLRNSAAALLGLLFCLSQCACAIQQPDPATATQALTQMEEEWLNVSSSAALDRILADDFIHVLKIGFITKAQELEHVRSMSPPPTHGPGHFEDMRVRVYGNTGIVNRVVVETNDQGAITQKTRFTDVFVYREGRWQAVNAQELPVPVSASGGAPH